MEGCRAVTDRSGGVLQVCDLELRRTGRTILAHASFGVSRGEVVALMGESGSGKTTILRTIAGLESFDAGRMVVDGVCVAPGKPAPHTLRELRKRVGMVFQFHYLFDHLSAAHNVWLAPVYAQRIRRPDAERRARELLRILGVEHRADALPRDLSGGEAQRVAIARALAVDPPILLLDEPTASLDADRRVELAGVLRSLAGRNRTLVVATHDAEFAGDVATRVLRVADGRVSS